MATTKIVKTKDVVKDVTTSLKKEIANSPKDVLKALGLDDVIAVDDKKKNISVGDLLEGVPVKKRAGLSAALAESLVNNEILQQNVLVEIGKLIPGNFEPAEVIKPVIPAVKPKVDPKIVVLPPLRSKVIPTTPIIPKPPIVPDTPLPGPRQPSKIKVLIKPKVDVLVKPKIDAIVKPTIDVLVKPESVSRIQPKIVPVIDVTGNLELQLAEVQRIRKSLPKNATKAEKKAAANAEQQIKNLMKAAKRAEPKAKKATIKKAKKVKK